MKTFARKTSRPYGHGVCLVVEDSSFDQERIRRILDCGFQHLEIVMADSIETARAATAAHDVTIILLDNNLPDGNGANFAVELSETPEFASIPVVMISDWPTPFMFHKAKQAGVLHVVEKSDFGARFIHSALKQVQSLQHGVA